VISKGMPSREDRSARDRKAVKKEKLGKNKKKGSNRSWGGGGCSKEQKGSDHQTRKRNQLLRDALHIEKGSSSPGRKKTGMGSKEEN